MQIFKIFRAAEWSQLQQDGQTRGAPVDLADGYIHFSTAEQVDETLSKHFSGAGDLFLLACDTDALGSELRWEPSRGGALFPHLYRQLTLQDVIWARPIQIIDGKHCTGLTT